MQLDETALERIAANPYKKDFPLLASKPDVVFLDSAATAQRPQCVLRAIEDFYTNMNANPLRGLYSLSAEATEAIDKARGIVAEVIGGQKREVVFTRNTSESLNMVAKSFAASILKPGDEVAITIMEHHSNLIPWQEVCKQTGAQLVYLYPSAAGEISDEEIASKIGPATKIVSVAGISNVLGVELPLKKFADAVHANSGYLVVDAAQSVPHIPVNVAELQADFLAFSAHKVFGPFGIGVLWGRAELLETMEPVYTGGEMIDSVTTEGATWAPIPHKFEAGTQDAAGIYATGVALDYLFNTVGLEAVAQREHELVVYALNNLRKLDFVDIVGAGDPALTHGVISFNVRGVHPHDVASILDMHKVCIRAGHHCAQPLLAWLETENLACCRASIAFYNDKADIDAFIAGLKEVKRLFALG